jgi:hypothetical protein
MLSLFAVATFSLLDAVPVAHAASYTVDQPWCGANGGAWQNNQGFPGGICTLSTAFTLDSGDVLELPWPSQLITYAPFNNYGFFSVDGTLLSAVTLNNHGTITISAYGPQIISGGTIFNFGTMENQGYIYSVGPATEGCGSVFTGNPMIVGTVYFLACTTTVVVCSPGFLRPGWSASCAATVTGESPTGVVEFTSSSGAGVFAPSGGQCTLTAGTCAVAYSDTSLGTPTITATYLGDTGNNASTGAFFLTVSVPPPPDTEGGVYMPPGTPYEANGNNWVTPGGSVGGPDISSYFFVDPPTSYPPIMFEGWGGMYGTYGGQQGWIVTFY